MAQRPLHLIGCKISFVEGLRVDVCVRCIFFNELAAWLNIVTHEHGEYLVGLGSILYCYLFQQARLGIHCRFPQLFRVHLAKTLVALGVDARPFLSATVLVDECLALLLVVAILRHLVLVGAFIEWGSGDIEMPFFYDFWHEAEEKSHYEGVDV